MRYDRGVEEEEARKRKENKNGKRGCEPERLEAAKKSIKKIN